MKPKQHTLWLLAALFAPLAHDSGTGWLSALLASAAVLPLSLLPKRWTGQPKPLAVVQMLWLGAVAGVLISGSTAYWPSDNDLVVPLTILALAALTNSLAAPRLGAVLALCIALLSIPAAIFGAAKIEPAWLRPEAGEWPWALTLVLLLPNLPAGGGNPRSPLYAGIAAVLLSALTQGTISTNVAASVPDPFFQTARTLGYLEPILAAAMTLGWYAMTIYLLESARTIAAESNMMPKWATVLTLGTATGIILLRVQLSATYLTLLSTFLWVFSPFLTKMKKVEKT